MLSLPLFEEEETKNTEKSGNSSAKKYMAVWMKGQTSKGDYEVFIDGTSEENKTAAKAKYDEMVPKAYSVNLCEIVESTDY